MQLRTRAELKARRVKYIVVYDGEAHYFDCMFHARDFAEMIGGVVQHEI